MQILKNKNYFSMVKKSFLSLIVIFIMVITIVFSMINNRKIYNQYHELIESQIHFNDFSIKLDSINNRLSLGYMYQRFDQIKGIEKDIQEVKKENQQLKKKPYLVSRAFVDYCNMVDTYLDECLKLAFMLEHTEGEDFSSEDYKSQELLSQFESLQYTISYININFRAVYSEEVKYIRKIEKGISIRYMRVLVVILSLLFVAVLMSVFYVKSISKTAMQLKKLTGFASKLRSNPYLEEEIVITSNDELAIFAMAFDEMVKTIQIQINEIKENAEIREKLKNTEIERLEINGSLQTSRFQLLQSRINPHFLFNTLNMIKATALSEGADLSYELIETTAQLLQYNL
ncbi:MAG: histidine kinase, partial [Spirochaetales bacterium]|nr:histidine kinase [Spirochaetales bacterium]